MKGCIHGMSTKTLYGQMTVVDDQGNETILHHETNAAVVLVNKDSNTNGTDGGSSIPTNVDTLQKLTDKMGDMAFKSVVTNSDLESEFVILDELDETNIIPVESEINDNAISNSLTWSSTKINGLINQLLSEISRLSTELDDLRTSK